MSGSEKAETTVLALDQCILPTGVLLVPLGVLSAGSGIAGWLSGGLPAWVSLFLSLNAAVSMLGIGGLCLVAARTGGPKVPALLSLYQVTKAVFLAGALSFLAQALCLAHRLLT